MSLSTHVLNTTTGNPAEGLTFELFGTDGADGGAAIEVGATDADGRYRFTTPLDPGTYRLRFASGDYLAASDVASFSSLYPYVDITFFVTQARGGADGHLHIPLLLSPYGYSTYQGS
ncbi:MAG: hydroxyisourate hydrolase [Mycobacteriaceae bacterium]|uniref:hydroxyisourate hydrolase n=1 Tax=Corynebacterium sp. TaxID=1720 RepID=UPI003F976BDD